MSNSVEQNLRQAASDLLGVKAGLIAKGVEVPYGTPSSEYGQMIEDIQSGTTISAVTFKREGWSDFSKFLVDEISFPATAVGSPAVDSFLVKKFIIESGRTALPALQELRAKEIVIPNTITSVAESGFSSVRGFNFNEESNSCSDGDIDFIKLPEQNVVSLGRRCFNSTKAKTINVGGARTIPTDCFGVNSTVKNIIFSANLTTISDYAFTQTATWFAGNIYFKGTESQWASVSKGERVDLSSATIHYNYTGDGSEL